MESWPKGLSTLHFCPDFALFIYMFQYLALFTYIFKPTHI